MNRRNDFDKLMREWVDPGEDRLPLHHLHGALAEIETTRQRGAASALLEDFLMGFQPLAAPLAIAAVLAVAIGALAVVNQPAPIGPDPTGTPVPSHSGTAAPISPSPSEVEPSVDATAAPTEPAARLLRVSFAVPFTITAPAEWVTDQHPARTLANHVIDAGFGRRLLFTVEGAETVDAWVEELSSNSAMTVSEPEAIVLGGAPGFSLTATLNEGGEPVEVGKGAVGWLIERGWIHHLWVVDVGGETVFIVTESTVRAAESWRETVETALATIAWDQ